MFAASRHNCIRTVPIVQGESYIVMKEIPTSYSSVDIIYARQLFYCEFFTRKGNLDSTFWNLSNVIFFKLGIQKGRVNEIATEVERIVAFFTGSEQGSIRIRFVLSHVIILIMYDK